MTSKRHLACITLAALGLLTCTAPVRAVQFRLVAWDTQDSNLQFDAHGAPTEVQASTNVLSPQYESKGSGPIILYKRVEHEGKPRKQVACTVDIPAGLEQGLLLLIPGDDSKTVDRKVLPDSLGFISPGAPLIYDYVWLDDSPSAHPPGTIEFRNMASLPIAFKIEQQQCMLAPKDKIQVPLITGARQMSFRAAAAMIDGKWKVFACNPLATNGPERMLVIIRDGPAAKNVSGEPNISVVRLYDWPAPPKPAPADLASSTR